MTIDGINISTFGLKVEGMEGEVSLPARKKNLSVPSFELKDIVFQEKPVKMSLFGTYVDLPTLYSNVEDFKTLIKTSLVHAFVRPGHGLNFSGAIVNGVKVDIDNKTAVLAFSINIVE